MKIAIVGSSGYIAKHLMKAFTSQISDCEIVKIDMVGDVDLPLQLTAPEEFEYDKLKGIEYVIFTAAISGPDMCANDFEKCWNINVTGTSYFIREAIQRGVKVLFFSSDAAFGDIPGHIYDEDSETKAYTAYGKMKKTIEDEFKGNPLFKCIRLSYVASANDKFISYCLNCIRNGETADIFHPFYRNCTTVGDVIKAIIWLLNNWTKFNSFVLDVTGTELVSRIRMADELNRYFGNKLKYVVSKPDESFFKNRPQVTQMKSKYLYKLGIVEEQTFTEKFQKELQNIEL